MSHRTVSTIGALVFLIAAAWAGYHAGGSPITFTYAHLEPHH